MDGFRSRRRCALGTEMSHDLLAPGDPQALDRHGDSYLKRVPGSACEFQRSLHGSCRRQSAAAEARAGAVTATGTSPQLRLRVCSIRSARNIESLKSAASHISLFTSACTAAVPAHHLRHDPAPKQQCQEDLKHELSVKAGAPPLA